MIKSRLVVAKVALAALAATPLFIGAAQAQKTAQAKEIGGKFLCMCGCTQVLTQCNHVGCTVSTSMLKKLDQSVAQGDSEEKITQGLVQEFGTTVYAEPPKTGLSLVAWAMPTVYLILGAILVVFVIARWRKVAVTSALTPVSAPRPSGISQESLDRARSQAARETED
jgi:cytochrome c-type biogenesis protein CcmH/NrfF